MNIHYRARDPHPEVVQRITEQVYGLIRASTVYCSPLSRCEIWEALNISGKSADAAIRILLDTGRIERKVNGYVSLPVAAPEKPKVVTRSDFIKPIPLAKLMGCR